MSNPDHPVEQHIAEVEEGDPVGFCDSCGIVTGDQLEYNFPCPAECAKCGSELDEVMISQRDQEVVLG